jgi:hypothetical protein
MHDPPRPDPDAIADALAGEVSPLALEVFRHFVSTITEGHRTLPPATYSRFLLRVWQRSRSIDPPRSLPKIHRHRKG